MEIRQKPWNAVNSLDSLEGRISIPPEDCERFEAEIWNDLCSEFDSVHFYQFAMQPRFQWSGDFNRLLKAWLEDEERHAAGFTRLYSLCFGIGEATLQSDLESRPSNFEALEWFFEDEFRLCLLLAYDELVTTISYHADIPFYRLIGGARLEAWIRDVKADEALHFSNLLEIIRTHHLERISEAVEVIEKVLELDLEKRTYNSTFVLDHTDSHFSPELLRGCANRISNKLEKMSCKRC
jgi:hypothetical protein